MNLFEQYVEKIIFNLYYGEDPEWARKTTSEIVKDIVASAQFDKNAVDEFLEM